MRRLAIISLLGTILSKHAESYTIPELNRRALAGLWKLSRQLQHYPMKEFTVYPKKTAASVIKAAEEYLLMLKEDGSFRQYGDGDEVEKNRVRIIKRDITEKTREQTVMGLGFQNGTWDFVDGKLLLAAERPGGVSNDTLLVGKVVATSQSSLMENPVTHDQKNTTNAASNPARDTHLSVPKGSVKIGKFFYPRHHPSFFEQPMFNPLSADRFELKQVLGTLNTASEEKELVEKFRRSDFANRTFLLTSHPIPTFKPKGDLRWSIKYNKYVEDPAKGKTSDEEETRPVNILVMEVHLFPNQTFCTTAGLGNAATLRGKWDIMGDKRDSFWMQVWLFGFGRSVSGSTYSEGPALTQDDAKMYWGEIGYVGDDEEEKDTTNSATKATKPLISRGLLQVKGSVALGWGLEPQPVARFIMTEKEAYVEGKDVQDDDTEIEEEQLLELLEGQSFGENNEQDIDWSSSFQ